MLQEHLLVDIHALRPTLPLELCPLVLEPDLDLSLAQCHGPCQAPAPLLRQVRVGRERRLKRGQLLRGEGRPRSLGVVVGELVVLAGRLGSSSALVGPRTWNKYILHSHFNF